MRTDPKKKSKILVVDDEDTLRGFICDALTCNEWDVHSAGNKKEAMRIAENNPCDVLITDILLKDESGIELACDIRKQKSHTAVIFITGFPKKEHIIFAEDLDAEFLTKPFTVRQLHFSVLAALEKNKKYSQTGAEPDDNTLGIIGMSSPTIKLREQIARIGPAEFPVFICGPSGTGKELVAQAIHRCSRRAKHPMITINCAAIPKHLEEAEFFGYTRGAFTGAEIAKHGIIASAQDSTLFLDEVGELSLDMQAKLLRVLDTGEFRRIGENSTQTADVRIISATNRDIENMIKEGAFREDLYFRLKAAVVKTLPLAKRKEDIPSLVKAFIAENSHGKKVFGITADAMSYLVEREWKGNVRELKHTLSMLCHFSRGSRRINMSVLKNVIDTDIENVEKTEPYMQAKEKAVKAFENDFFTRLVKRYEGNLNRAAKATGMYRPNLIKKLRALNIDPDHYRQQSK